MEARDFIVCSHYQNIFNLLPSMCREKAEKKSILNPRRSTSDRTPCMYNTHASCYILPPAGAPPPVRFSFKYVPAIYAKQSSLPRTIQPEQLALDIMASIDVPHSTQQHLLPLVFVRRSRSHPALVSY